MLLFDGFDRERLLPEEENSGFFLSALARLRILAERFRNAFGRRRASGPGPASASVLRAGTVRCFERFGPGTVNRGAVLFCCVRPGPGRRDFQEAYNDALRRASTPWLALLDTDAFAISREVWPRVGACLADDTVAAVACAPRTAVEGHDTVALVLKVAAYRAALEAVPEGFLPRVEREKPGVRPRQWIGHDTEDLLTRAVERSIVTSR